VANGKPLALKHSQVKGMAKPSTGKSGFPNLLPQRLKVRVLQRHQLERGDEFPVELLGRALPAVNTDQGVRAVIKAKPIDPGVVERYLESKFGDALPRTRRAMTELVNALTPKELAQRGFGLYEQFRPVIPAGVQGWGANGELDLGRISKLAQGKQ